jgi:hypothetical protein
VNLAIEQLEKAIEQAIDVYETNKRNGSPGLSTAYDSGRIDGLRQALEIIVGVNG